MKTENQDEQKIKDSTQILIEAIIESHIDKSAKIVRRAYHNQIDKRFNQIAFKNNLTGVKLTKGVVNRILTK